MAENPATKHLDEDWDRQVLTELLAERQAGRFLDEEAFKIRSETFLVEASRKYASDG